MSGSKTLQDYNEEFLRAVEAYRASVAAKDPEKMSDCEFLIDVLAAKDGEIAELQEKLETSQNHHGVDAGLARMRMGEVDRLQDEVGRLRAALEAVEACVCEITTQCTHDENDREYRPLGDNYGWCSTCGTKVEKGINYSKDALRIARDALGGGS